MGNAAILAGIEGVYRLMVQWGAPDIGAGRYSPYLMVQFRDAEDQMKSRVVMQLQAAEAEQTTSMKDATEFNNAPLKGLWHQHFLMPDGWAANLARIWLKDGQPKSNLNQRFEGLDRKLKGRDPTDADVAAFVHELTAVALERRMKNREMTGAWIIFALAPGCRRYYLALAEHDGDLHFLLEQLWKPLACTPEQRSFLPAPSSPTGPA